MLPFIGCNIIGCILLSFPGVSISPAPGTGLNIIGCILFLGSSGSGFGGSTGSKGLGFHSSGGIGSSGSGIGTGIGSIIIPGG